MKEYIVEEALKHFQTTKVKYNNYLNIPEPDDALIKLSSDRRTGTLPNGKEIEIIPSEGLIQNVENGIKIDANTYLLQRDFKPPLVFEGRGQAFLLLRTINPLPTFYIRRLKSNTIYEIPDTLLDVPIRQAFFSQDARHILLIGTSSTPPADSAEVHYAILKNFFISNTGLGYDEIVTGTITIGSITPNPSTPSAPPVPSPTVWSGDTWTFELDTDPALPENGGSEENQKVIVVNGYVFTNKLVDDERVQVIDVLGNFNNAQVAGIYYRVKQISNGSTTLDFTYGPFAGGERTVTVVQTPPGTSNDYIQKIGDVNWYNNRNSNLGDYNQAQGITDNGTRITGTRNQSRTVVTPFGIQYTPDFIVTTNLSTSQVVTGSLFFDVQLENDVPMVGFRNPATGGTTTTLSESNDSSINEYRLLRPYDTLIATPSNANFYIYTDTLFFDFANLQPPLLPTDNTRPVATNKFHIFRGTDLESGQERQQVIEYTYAEGELNRGKAVSFNAEGPLSLRLQDFIIK